MGDDHGGEGREEHEDGSGGEHCSLVGLINLVENNSLDTEVLY